jgi:hypothetical protein
MRLSHGDNMGVRMYAPFALLNLGKDDDCDNFIRYDFFNVPRFIIWRPNCDPCRSVPFFEIFIKLFFSNFSKNSRNAKVERHAREKTLGASEILKDFEIHFRIKLC